MTAELRLLPPAAALEGNAFWGRGQGQTVGLPPSAKSSKWGVGGSARPCESWGHVLWPRGGAPAHSLLRAPSPPGCPPALGVEGGRTEGRAYRCRAAAEARGWTSTSARCPSLAWRTCGESARTGTANQTRPRHHLGHPTRHLLTAVGPLRRSGASPDLLH